jgi:hypothetical protein
MLGTDAAVASHEEQRLNLKAARKERENRHAGNLAHTQTGRDDEIA